MQGLNKDEERQMLVEILADKLTVLEEYLQAVLVTQEDMPIIKEGDRDIKGRLTVFEGIVREHDKELISLG